MAVTYLMTLKARIMQYVSAQISKEKENFIIIMMITTQDI